MRIGIMGGTFDPIHNGHLMLGEYAYQQFHLDEVWYMPNGNPPHKSNPEIRKDLQDRAEMTRLAIEEIPYFRLCTYEMDRKETSYSYQTMEYFKETYPQDEFYFIIGADSLFNLETWKCPERLLKTADKWRDSMKSTGIVRRLDDLGRLVIPKEMRRQITYLKEKYACDIRLLRTPVMPVSSSEIRQMIRGGETEDLPIPKKVADYIDLNRLYQVSEHDGNNT